MNENLHGYSFHQISTNLHTSIIIRGCYLFWRSAKNEKFYGTLKFLLTQALEISKRYSYSFHPMSVNVMRTLASMIMEYRLLLLLARSKLQKYLLGFSFCS